jgi:hypothetical protein
LPRSNQLFIFNTMPKLNEYIGSLVSSITSARVMSDIQSVKVAEDYAKHDLLKHFSIPRMRIETVEMTVPIALDTMKEKIETEYEPIDNTAFNALVYKELVNNLGLTKLPNELSQKLKTEIAKQTQNLEQNLRITKDLSSLQTYSQELASFVSMLEQELPPSRASSKRKINVESIPQRLDTILLQEIKITSQKKTLEDLNVIVEAHKLKEQKPENIIYIKIKIVEDGMEWNRSENNEGNVESRLLPE